MTLTQALIMGIVEGLTEFLPISSTGHLILASHFLNIEDSAQTKSFEVIIQSGAILAVCWHYRKQLLQMFQHTLQLKQPGFGQSLSVLLAFLPTAVLGFTLRKWIKANLFGINPVIFAMIFGGVLMLVIEIFFKRKNKTLPPSHLSDPPLTLNQSLSIGFAQSLAMWPGMSRSMTSILGARLVGLSPVHAASFSFLLAIPTIFGATVLDIIKERETLMHADPSHLLALLVGSLSSFIVALIVIRVFLNFLKTQSLEVFAWYRIIAGLALWVFLK